MLMKTKTRERGVPLYLGSGFLMAKCLFRKKNGSRCEANAQPTNGLRVFHDPARANDGKRARQAGGLNRTHAAATLAPDTPDHPLGTTKDVANLLGDSINLLRRGGQMAATRKMSKRCSAKNRNGKRCGAWAVTGATKCALHANPERAAELGSKHGRRVTFRPQPNALDLPHKPLKSIEEVRVPSGDDQSSSPRLTRCSCRECDWVPSRDSSEGSRPTSCITRNYKQRSISWNLHEPVSAARIAYCARARSFRSVPAATTKGCWNRVGPTGSRRFIDDTPTRCNTHSPSGDHDRSRMIGNGTSPKGAHALRAIHG